MHNLATTLASQLASHGIDYMMISSKRLKTHSVFVIVFGNYEEKSLRRSDLPTVMVFICCIRIWCLVGEDLNHNTS